MTIYLTYWKPKGRFARKKFKTIEKAQDYGQKLRKKDGYTVMKYGCIHVYETKGGSTTIVQHDLFE